MHQNEDKQKQKPKIKKLMDLSKQNQLAYIGAKE